MSISGMDMQASITKYMPGTRQGQQALSPIMESAGEGPRHESAETRRKTRGRTPKTDTSTGEGFHIDCSQQQCRIFSRSFRVAGCASCCLTTLSPADHFLQCCAGRGKTKAANPEGALTELPEAAEGEPVSPLSASRLLTPLQQDHQRSVPEPLADFWWRKLESCPEAV